MKAQIAANQKGITLVNALIEEYSLEVVQAYMMHIRHNAADAVRQLLKGVAKNNSYKDMVAVDYMDDGTPIHLRVSIDHEKGTALFDFEGTGPEVYGNTNTPESVLFCHHILSSLSCKSRYTFECRLLGAHHYQDPSSFYLEPFRKERSGRWQCTYKSTFGRRCLESL